VEPFHWNKRLIVGKIETMAGTPSPWPGGPPRSASGRSPSAALRIAGCVAPAMFRLDEPLKSILGWRSGGS